MKTIAAVFILAVCLMIPGYALSQEKACCSNPACKCTVEQCMSGKCTCAAGCCKSDCQAPCCKGKDGKGPLKADKSKSCGCAKQDVQ